MRIIIPEKPDHLLVHLAARSSVSDVLRAGCKVYVYANGFLHQKVFLIDRSVAVVGSVNLDNRSIHLNFEVSAVVHDELFNEEVALMLSRDMNASREITGDDAMLTSPVSMIAGRVCRLFSPVL